MKLTVAGIVLAIPFIAWGDLNTHLNAFFDSFGSVANVNSAEIYEGQKAGYATGGGISVRNRVMNSKLGNVQLPEINAGCGGIDIYTGGFSFIKSDELINTLKSIGSNAKGYAFLLGLETVSPQIANNIISSRVGQIQLIVLGLTVVKQPHNLLDLYGRKIPWPKSISVVRLEVIKVSLTIMSQLVINAMLIRMIKRQI